MFHTFQKILPQKCHHSNAVYPLRYIECQTFLIALSNPILCHFLPIFIASKYCQWAMIDICSTNNDYVDNMDLTKLDWSNRHIAKQSNMQEATMESVYWFHKGWNIINLYTKHRKKWNKTQTKYKDKISLKDDTKCIILHT